VVPEEIGAAWDARARGKRTENKWKRAFKAYRAEHPALADEYERRMAGMLPDGFSAQARALAHETQAAGGSFATRQSSQAVLNGFGPLVPELLGGSADLTGSNLTRIKGTAEFTRERESGRYLHYGVREFGMSAIMNGIGLHGGFIAYGGTFLVFSDYARNALRMAALMKLRSVFVLTHDSIGLGEDGPTHQPVEHVASLRLVPNMEVWRPCDGVETLAAWTAALERRDGPTSLVLTRQAVPHQARDAAQVDAIRRGGYVLFDSDGAPECVLIATGSEVGLAMEAARQLAAEGRRVRVVSMPCVSVFAAQDRAWQDAVLPPGVERRVAVEAGVTEGWWRWVGTKGRVVGIDRFGASAPARDLFRHYGLTADAVAGAARELLAG
jgi:transketolase